MMNDSKYTELIAAHITGTLSDSEQAELDAWLAADDANRKVYDELAKVWSLTEEYDTDYTPDMAQASARFEAALDAVDAGAVAAEPEALVGTAAQDNVIKMEAAPKQSESGPSSASGPSTDSNVKSMAPWRIVMRAAAAVVIAVCGWLGYDAMTSDTTMMVATLQR